MVGFARPTGQDAAPERVLARISSRSSRPATRSSKPSRKRSATTRRHCSRFIVRRASRPLQRIARRVTGFHSPSRRAAGVELSLGPGIGRLEQSVEVPPAHDPTDEWSQEEEAELDPRLVEQAHVEQPGMPVPVEPARGRQPRSQPVVPGGVGRRAALPEERPEGIRVERPERGELELQEVELRGVPVDGDDRSGAVERGVEGDVAGRRDDQDPVAGLDREGQPVDPVVLPDAAVDDARSQSREAGADSRPPSTIHRIAASTGALWVAAGWGAAEASLFFLVPDLWVMFVALFAPGRTLRALGATIAGALVGATLLWWLTPSWPALGDAIAALPGIRPVDLATASSELSGQGLGAFLNGPLQGLPVKLYVHGAALLGQPLGGVLLMVALNRLERVGLSAAVAWAVGTVFREPIERHPRAVLAGYIGLVLVIYGAYFTLR